MKLRCNHCNEFYDSTNVERAYLPEVGEAHCCSAYCYTKFKMKPKDQPQDTTLVPEYVPKQPFYKGKGEHSVNELEAICEAYKKYVSYLNSRP